MSHPDSPRSFRRDGWTIRRQLAFLDVLTQTRSVTAAARAVGMSRESAYRLRRRPSASLFAAAWGRALEGHRAVNFAARRGVRKKPAFPRLSLEGHEVHDLPF